MAWAWSTVLLDLDHTNESLSIIATVDSVDRVCLDVSLVCVSAPSEWLPYVCMYVCMYVCIYAHIKTYKKKNLSTSLGFD